MFINSSIHFTKNLSFRLAFKVSSQKPGKKRNGAAIFTGSQVFKSWGCISPKLRHHVQASFCTSLVSRLSLHCFQCLIVRWKDDLGPAIQLRSVPFLRERPLLGAKKHCCMQTNMGRLSVVSVSGLEQHGETFDGVQEAGS